MNKYEQALSRIEKRYADFDTLSNRYSTRATLSSPLNEPDLETALEALEIVARLHQEPSTSMLTAGADAWLKDPSKKSSTLFKAMRDQLLKEIREND